MVLDVVDAVLQVSEALCQVHLGGGAKAKVKLKSLSKQSSSAGDEMYYRSVRDRVRIVDSKC